MSSIYSSATISTVKFNSTGNLQSPICDNDQQHKHHYISEKYNTQNGMEEDRKQMTVLSVFFFSVYDYEFYKHIPF